MLFTEDDVACSDKLDSVTPSPQSLKLHIYSLPLSVIIDCDAPITSKDKSEYIVLKMLVV